jgi:aspartyl-tRNA(Asn)/glutamyl-tRNA(Gln) amidotransferase subunit A
VRSAPTIRALAASLASGDLPAADLAAATSSAVRASDGGSGGLNAFLAHEPALLEARAAAADEELARTRREGLAPGRLTGVPVAIKDNLTTLDYPTTCGSRILEGWRPPYEATVVRRLRAAGALIAGKTNLDEFAMGSSTENSAFGPTRNPYDPTRVPGGSSGGSAAAVAAGLVPAALGSDTGGSVRQPAALCGVVGLKPTYGAVSRYGLVAFASSLDQVGTLGRTVEDAALLLEVIAGHDPLDSTSSTRQAPELLPELDRGVEGLVVGMPVEYLGDPLSPSVRGIVEEAAGELEAAGAEVREVSLPNTRFAIPAYYVLAPAEASSNLARYDGVRYGRRGGMHEGAAPTPHEQRPGTAADDRVGRMYGVTRSEGFGPEVKRRIMLGTYALSAGYYDRYYGRAQRVRSLITGDFKEVFGNGVDVLLTPTTPGPAFPLGERVHDPYSMYLADVFTTTANLAGIPGISIPIGNLDGLPVGGQLLADHWGEPVLVRVAAVLERAARARTSGDSAGSGVGGGGPS